ncbi:MAG: MBL fold metallo-hydrolase [Candidatus Cyclobacteriaceae bacterium M3_2C_046]
MKVKQFFDDSLAHASYAVLSQNEIALIDPARDPKPYLDYAEKHDARIIAVIETHPHADFVSSHLEISLLTGATIYVSEKLGADYPHQTLDQGDQLRVGKIILEALNTPGHSPDSISIVAKDEQGRNRYVFTGDTLFIGDVGRPDLRESAGKITAKKEELARDMFHSTRDILMKLEKDVVVYPAHGAGSLCGKSLSPERSSTIGKEIDHNPALQPMNQDEFVQFLLKDQPFMPKYFGYNVELNKKGVKNYRESISSVEHIDNNTPLKDSIVVIDARASEQFKQGHLKGAINIINDNKFETWLGAIVDPGEKFYLITKNESELEEVIARTAKIGYETQIEAALFNPDRASQVSPALDLESFKSNPGDYYIVDIRNPSELEEGKYFDQADHIPLYDLREKASQINTDKPVIVHCSGGYRSAAGASIIQAQLPNNKVIDMGDKIKEFENSKVN